MRMQNSVCKKGLTGCSIVLHAMLIQVPLIECSRSMRVAWLWMHAAGCHMAWRSGARFIQQVMLRDLRSLHPPRF